MFLYYLLFLTMKIQFIFLFRSCSVDFIIPNRNKIIKCLWSVYFWNSTISYTSKNVKTLLFLGRWLSMQKPCCPSTKTWVKFFDIHEESGCRGTHVSPLAAREAEVHTSLWTIYLDKSEWVRFSERLCFNKQGRESGRQPTLTIDIYISLY